MSCKNKQETEEREKERDKHQIGGGSFFFLLHLFYSPGEESDRAKEDLYRSHRSHLRDQAVPISCAGKGRKGNPAGFPCSLSFFPRGFKLAP